MARVYLETSFVSAYVSDRDDTASAYRREVSRRWWDEQRQRHDVFVSAEVVAELSHEAFRGGSAALNMIRDLPRLQISDQVRGVAEVFVRELVMPQPIGGDAVHVAVCCVHRVDCVLSWNVRHLANPSKEVHLRVLCARIGLVPPKILTPDNYFWEER